MLLSKAYVMYNSVTDAPVHAVLAQNKMGLCALPEDTSSAHLWLLIVTGTAIKPRSVKEKHASPGALQCACISVHSLHTYIASQKCVQRLLS